MIDPDQSTASLLADSIGNLTLNDTSSHSIGDNTLDFGNQSQRSFVDSDEDGDEDDLSSELSKINNLIDEIKSQIFQIEEKRHSNDVVTSNESENSGDGDVSLVVPTQQDLELMRLEEKIERVSRKIGNMEEGLISLEKKEKEDNDGSDDDEEGDSPYQNKTSERRNSLTSLSSLTSFDEDFAPLQKSSSQSKSLRKSFNEVLESWNWIQKESLNLKQELADDKYLKVFNSTCEKAKVMIGSLEKGLGACLDFIWHFHHFRAENVLKRGEDSTSNEEMSLKYQELKKLRQTFETKQSYYLPACEQIFGVLERGVRDRVTSNGMILRKLGELKGDWKDLKERISRMERDFRGVEKVLRGGVDGDQNGRSNDQNGNGYLSQNSTPIKSSRPGLRPKHSGRNLTSNSATSGSGSSAPVSPASTSSNLNSPPPKPPKSLRRTSMVSDQSPPIVSNSSNHHNSNASPSIIRTLRSKISNSNFSPGSSLPSGGGGGIFGRQHARSASTSTYQQQLAPENQRGLGSSNLRGSSVTNRPAWNNSIKVERDKDGLIDRDRDRYTSAGPDNSFESIGSNSSSNSYGNRRPSFAESTGGSGRSTPNAFGPSSYRGTGNNASMLGAERPGITMNNSRIVSSSRSKTPQPQPTWINSRAGSEPPLPNLPSQPKERVGSARPSSRNINHTRNTSVNVNRPASATGHYAEPGSGTGSRPVSSIGNYYHPPQSTHEAPNETGKSPWKRDSMIPRLAFPSNNSSDQQPPRPGSSLSQTSNSQIMTGPPPSRYSGASRLSMQTPEPMIAARVGRMNMYAKPSGKTSSKPPVSSSSRSNTTTLSNGTSPLIIRKNNATGRTTPLSAAALANIPNAGPPSIGGSGSVGTGGGGSGSSVANFRAQRAAASNPNYGGGGRPGAITPNYSDGGNSSIGGYSNSTWNQNGNYRGSAGIGGGGLDLYRANPNDTLDVEVARIVNEQGARCERIDLPLPRGQKLELGPGKSAQARYEIAGKKVACRMLELVSLEVVGHGRGEFGLTLSLSLCSIDLQGQLDLKLVSTLERSVSELVADIKI